MFGRKHKDILSLNLKKLADNVNNLKIILVLQNEMLLLVVFRNLLLKKREDIPRYGKTINHSFLWTTFSVKNAYFKMFLSTEVVEEEYFFNASFK